MVSSQDIQNAYQNMYVCLRKYTWPVDVVEMIAELEVAVFNAFTDIKDVRVKFQDLQKAIKEVYLDDEEFKKSVQEFRELIDKNEDHFLRLYQVKEALKHED